LPNNPAFVSLLKSLLHDRIETSVPIQTHTHEPNTPNAGTNVNVWIQVELWRQFRERDSEKVKLIYDNMDARIDQNIYWSVQRVLWTHLILTG